MMVGMANAGVRAIFVSSYGCRRGSSEYAERPICAYALLISVFRVWFAPVASAWLRW
jgi:hypothetical protein